MNNSILDDNSYLEVASAIESMEQKFNVVYPNIENATYCSSLNYSDELKKPLQRWYRYKEGYSIDLVKRLINEFSFAKQGIILDPFMGSGSTLLAANQLGYSGKGFEVNPFSFFLSKCKLDNYSEEIIRKFKVEYTNIISQANQCSIKYSMPALSISNKVFDKNIEKYYMAIKALIDSLTAEEQVKNLLLLGWLACLETASNYRKAGNGLKIKKYAKPRQVFVEDVKQMLEEEYDSIYEDLLLKSQYQHNCIYNKSSLSMRDCIAESSVSGIIFSPPYANCFDYTEIYKLELWFGDFVKNYQDMRKLRKESLRSHLNGDFAVTAIKRNDFLDSMLARLRGKELWDKRIPKMLELYYSDLFQVIESCYDVLENNGFCCVIIGNSAYGGIVFPADLIVADYASKIGFKVERIEVARYLITSSQQYHETKELGKYIRESIVCLRK